MNYFEPTQVGKSCPVTPMMLEKEYVELGQFNPVKLLGWFFQLVTKIEELNIKPKRPKTPTAEDFVNITANWVKEKGSLFLST